jgi:hypothetical protein
MMLEKTYQYGHFHNNIDDIGHEHEHEQPKQVYTRTYIVTQSKQSLAYGKLQVAPLFLALPMKKNLRSSHWQLAVLAHFC